jgi:putative mRNA 3-end processing factor
MINEVSGVQLIFHGGAQEVGRSCIEVKTGSDRYLLDCGLKFHEAGFDYPAKVFEVGTLQGVFLSHAHLDHSGGLPFFEHYKLDCPIFCTPETKSISQILLKDSHKIARIKHLHEAFTNIDLKEVVKDMVNVRFNQPSRQRTITHEFLNAGHIPGSASVKLTVEGKTILYTGDYNTRTTKLMIPADPHTWGHVDVLITECTYGDRDLPDRGPLEEEFLQMVKDVLSRGGRVLVPVFAVGRAQEILIMLGKRDWPVPIYMDGMAKKVTRAVLDEHNPFVANRDLLARTFDKVQFVTSEEHRSQAAGGPGIFVTTSGMLQGGPAIHYLEHMWSDPKSAVLLTGYQVKNTNGWLLDNEHVAYVGGYRTKVQCEVHRFDFSGHLSQEDLRAAITATQPKILIFNHGNTAAIEHMAAWAKGALQCEVFAPTVGEQIEIIDGKPTMLRVYDEHPGQYLEEHQHTRDDHGHLHSENDE